MAGEVAAKCGICLFSVLFRNVWGSTDIDLEFKNGALGKKKGGLLQSSVCLKPHTFVTYSPKLGN